MKSLKILSIIFVMVLFSISCNKDFLEVKPLSEISAAAVWEDESLARAFVNGIYTAFTGISMGNNMSKFGKDVYCDEGHRRDNSTILNFNKGLLTPDLIPGWQGDNWQKLYKAIRSCNLFLEGLENATFDKDAMIGEVRFLRAWGYLHLTSLYGGVPIVSKTFQISDDFKVPRNSYIECIEFIVDDLDQAASLLPEVQSGNNRGRATKGAALALKSRVLLYAASDLYNTTVIPGYSNPELIGYTNVSSADRTARWQAAKNAAKAVIDMNVYSLYKPNPAPTDSVAKNYEELFLLKESVEDIWCRYFTATSININEVMNLINGANGYGGQGNNSPIGNLVDAFEMKDGTKFDWNNPKHKALPYSYREPRFYAYILYEGAKWITRPVYSIGQDQFGIIHTGYFERWNAANNKIIIEPGIDSRNSPYEPWNCGQTLYLMRKYLDPTRLPSDIRVDIPWRHIRYAEVLLNYAEACIELGQDEEARTHINMVRKRAGLPDITESGTALRDRYRNERRIELAFEDKRFFDVRRWAIGPQAYGVVYKANVLYKLLPDNTTSPNPTIFHEVLETRGWPADNKAYFFPILRDEMNKDDKLVQNPGY